MIILVTIFVTMATVVCQPPPECDEYLRSLDTLQPVRQFHRRDNFVTAEKRFLSSDEPCWERPTLSGNFYCFYNSLTSIPSNLPFRTRCIIFTGNQLTSLKPSDVRHLINLEILVLDSNPLTTIEGDFSSLPLKVLSLEGTSLGGLPVLSLPELKYYAQTNAAIHSLKSSDLLKISGKLQFLRLADCSIAKSDVNTFGSLSSLKYLDLEQNNFTKVPENLPPSLKELRFLYNYNVSQLGANSFSGLTNLQNLSVSARTISSNAFMNSPNLLQLKLQACAIQSNATSGLHMVNDFVVYGSFCSDRLLYLEPYAFSGLRSLTSFTMDRIAIETLPTGLFMGAEKLESLFIEFDNINSVQDGAFDGVPNLRTLRLTNNYIPVTKPVNLSRTFLGPNNFPALTLFDLSDFRIPLLNAGTFDVAPNLERLYMGYNMMTSMPSGVLENLHNLKYISLYNNPWICDCHLRWLKNLTDVRPDIFYGGENLQCDKPDKLHGKYFHDLNISDFTC